VSFNNCQKVVYSEFWIFEQKFCETQISKSEMAITLGHCKLGSSSWCHFVRIGVLLMTLYFKIVKTSWKKSGMARTSAKYKLQSCNWYHFVHIGVCQMISYSKLKNFKFLKKNSNRTFSIHFRYPNFTHS
jgi:hypothetical protein